MNRPDVSLIIATRDREKILRRALAAVSHQETGGQFTYEIIVADNGSQDRTRAMVEMAAIRFPWVRGTPLGRLVVPLVCRKRAVASG